jgi:hypothetical protein
MLISADRFVTVGLPGDMDISNLDEIDPLAKPQERVPFYLWDSSGTQLDATNSHWMEMFIGAVHLAEIFDNARALGCTTSQTSANKIGYLGFNDSSTGELKLLYNYDGSELVPDYNANLRDEHPYMFIGADELAHLYAIQQEGEK